jgi:hypothetical protein
MPFQVQKFWILMKSNLSACFFCGSWFWFHI